MLVRMRNKIEVTEGEKGMREEQYLTGNCIKRTLGYFLVMLLSLFLGLILNCDILTQKEEIFYEILNTFIPIGYILLEGMLFIMGYVGLYVRRRATFIYRFACILSCGIFAVVTGIYLFAFNDSFITFSMIIYGAITFSSLVLYYRLTDQQMTCVRYELLWPAIYVIALSAYMGFLVREYLVEGHDGFDLLVPLLIAFFYECFLFFSRILK